MTLRFKKNTHPAMFSDILAIKEDREVKIEGMGKSVT